MKLRVVASILMVLLSISAYHMVSGAVYPAKYEWILGTRPQFTPASGVATAQAVDSQGNTYVIGSYTIGILFGASSPLLTGGRPGAFVGKIKANGEFAWTQYITSTDAIVAGDGIAVTDQNVYIGGIFTDGSSATFSYDPNNVGPLTNGNTFIVKLDAATGNPVAKRIGVNNLNLNSVRLSVDGQSNVYAAGAYATEVRFGADTPLLTASNSAIYLYKFNQNLQFLTATTTQGTATSITNVDIATNSAGSSCVSATFTGGTVTLGALTPISAVGTGTGLAARFTANLSPVYLISITSPTTVGTGGIDIDSANNCYAVGQFQQSIVVGSLSGTSASGYSYYFTKLSPSGSALILTTSQGVSSLQRPDVSCTTGGICYLTGALDPTSSSGGTFTFGSYTYSYNTNRGTFMVTRFNAAGAVELITSGLTTILSYGIAITAQDNTVTVTGGFRDSVQFGPLSFNIFTSSATHTFVLRFTVTDKCPLCLAPNDNCCNLAIGQGVCYNTNVHTCTSQGYLCPKGTESCGVACYDPNIYTCLDGNFLCPADHLRCGSACYNPAVHVCLTGNFLCPVNHLRCGSACYLPSQYACQNNQLFTKCVPNQCAGNRPCCPATGQCYEHVHFSCSNTGVIPKCFGIPSDSPAVCSGHGTCSTPDLCECSGGYSGALCNIAP